MVDILVGIGEYVAAGFALGLGFCIAAIVVGGLYVKR
jgi:hypothetical protein